MGTTTIKHPVADRVKPSFVIFDIWALWLSALSARVPRCQKLQPSLHRTRCFIAVLIWQPWVSKGQVTWSRAPKTSLVKDFTWTGFENTNGTNCRLPTVDGYSEMMGAADW